MPEPPPTPRSIDVDRDEGLTIAWSDGVVSRLSAERLRRFSPSADARILRDSLEKNPLTVLPASSSGGSAPLRIEHVEPVGSYAIRIRFSDGHATGLYTWDCLRSLDAERKQADDAANAD